ncbi:hypothetical protein EBR66_07600 [bacterium]|nr:hypothetical protein [bacterium]
MEIELSKKKTITVSPAVTKDIEKVTVVRIVDLPVEKKVRAFVRELGRPIELPELSGENYGEWSDEDVEKAVASEIEKL